MYSIVRLQNGKFMAVCRIQDGVERRECDSEITAVQTLIGMARVYNGTYIRADEVEFYDEPAKLPTTLSPDDSELLEKIRRKELVVLPHNDLRVKYRLTDGECDLIIKIREGDCHVVEG